MYVIINVRGIIKSELVVKKVRDINYQSAAVNAWPSTFYYEEPTIGLHTDDNFKFYKLLKYFYNRLSQVRPHFPHTFSFNLPSQL